MWIVGLLDVYVVLGARSLPLWMLSESVDRAWIVKVNKDWDMFDKWKAKGTNNTQHSQATQKINKPKSKAARPHAIYQRFWHSPPLLGVQWPLATLWWHWMHWTLFSRCCERAWAEAALRRKSWFWLFSVTAGMNGTGKHRGDKQEERPDSQSSKPTPVFTQGSTF